MMSVLSELKPFFEPRSVAIVGASRTPGKPGHVTLQNFISNKQAGKFKGEIYPVNPSAEEILGLKCYPSVKDIPGDVDLAVVIVPAKFVPQVMRDCGEKGVKAAIIISAGFSEVGNVELEEEVKRIAQGYGIRVIGPNGLGVLDTFSGVDTMFVPEHKDLKGRPALASPRPPPGVISFISQSGAFGVAALDYMAGHGIGLSKFVSYGNRMDVDDADLVEYLAEDPSTRVIMVYIEGLKDGKRFMEAVEKAVAKKPVVVFKAGRTEAGARAAASHTAALAGSDVVYDAAFKQCGAIRASTMEEFFDYAKALAYMPPARGNRIAILTDGGGAGVMATDASELSGLKVIETPPGAYRRLKELQQKGIIVPFAALKNPIDLTGSADYDAYEQALRVLLEEEEIDGVVLIALHHVPGLSWDFAGKLADVILEYNKPVTVCDVGFTEMAVFTREEFERRKIPAYPSPERAARAMKALVDYGQYLRRRGLLDDYLKSWTRP